MKSHIKVLALACAAGVLVFFACTAPQNEAATDHATLPASLGQYYPPQKPIPEYLFAMFGLAEPFTGTISDALEGDFDNAQTNFEAFKKVYLENSKMVSEWTPLYPIKPIDLFGGAVASKDIGAIMAAADSVDLVCQNCHLANMVPVHQKYRWPNFFDIGLTDPVTQKDINWTMLMKMMETSFTGIGYDASQGQIEQARTQYKAFTDRFNELSVACMSCHETGRYYFVSKDITDLIDQIGTELNQKTVKADKIHGLIQTIGMESCTKCHLVHVPAAFTQMTASAH